MDWMLMPLRRYADFSGRSRRKEYWMFMLFFYIVMAVLAALMFAGGGLGSVDPATGEPAMGTLAKMMIGLLVLFVLAVFIPALAVQVRRFHDQDKSGWFVLLGFIPYVGGIIVFVFMCIEGTRGPNRFGPDPKANQSEDLQNVFS